MGAQAMLRRFNDLFRSPVLLRYLGASICALIADIGLFLALLQASVPATSASALGFSLGIAVHWFISSRLVFAATTAASGAERWRQKFLFLLSAGVGMVLTVSIVAGGELAGTDPRLAKLVAVGFSFVTTYILRRLFVFAVR
jgi:putative flippase GtrA